MLEVDKYAYTWVYSLIKYGDIYLKFFRESDYQKDDLFFSDLSSLNANNTRDILNEDINVNLHDKNDHLVPYLELYPNPGEVFDLTRFGKTAGYIVAPINIQTVSNALVNGIQAVSDYSPIMYQFKKSDIDIYQPTEFVHGCLQDSSSRVRDEISIFTSDDDFAKREDENIKPITYSVRRGQSVLHNVFSIWRQLSLLENSILLSRVTKSALLRIAQVNVGDMPKENVQQVLRNIKSLVEQKTAITKDGGMNEYINTGPMENTIYIPVHGDQGQITIQDIGGDSNVTGLGDLDYFKNKFFGALGVPKQYFSDNGDGTFDSGKSLAIVSSRYAKGVKRIQSTMIGVITDAVNIYLYDRGIPDYINRFTIHMQQPTTTEMTDRTTNIENEMRNVDSIMNSLSDIDDQIVKLRILESLLKPVLTDETAITYLQQYIEHLEDEREDDAIEPEQENEEPEDAFSLSEEEPEDDSLPESVIDDKLEDETLVLEEDALPNAEDLDIDLLNMGDEDDSNE